MVATHHLRKVPTSTTSDIFAKVKGRTDAFFVENCITLDAFFVENCTTLDAFFVENCITLGVD
jgi:hypothetical protein